MTAKQHEALAAAFKAFFAKNYPGMENETVRQHLLIGRLAAYLGQSLRCPPGRQS